MDSFHSLQDSSRKNKWVTQVRPIMLCWAPKLSFSCRRHQIHLWPPPSYAESTLSGREWQTLHHWATYFYKRGHLLATRPKNTCFRSKFGDRDKSMIHEIFSQAKSAKGPIASGNSSTARWDLLDFFSYSYLIWSTQSEHHWTPAHGLEEGQVVSL